MNLGDTLMMLQACGTKDIHIRVLRASGVIALHWSIQEGP